ncbi:hypothetical protein PTKIN_Ptkin17bG0138500 [Pterospermum kingtungense]
MAKTSAIALLLFIFVIVSCVPNTVVQGQSGKKHCTRDIDCQLQCQYGGFCNMDAGICDCLPPPVVGKGLGEADHNMPSASSECHTDQDSAKCEPNCKDAACIKGRL